MKMYPCIFINANVLVEKIYSRLLACQSKYDIEKLDLGRDLHVLESEVLLEFMSFLISARKGTFKSYFISCSKTACAS